MPAAYRPLAIAASLLHFQAPRGGASGSAPLALDLPSADEPLRYAMANWREWLAAHGASPHRAVAPSAGYCAPVALGADLRRRWHHLFGSSSDLQLPLPYHHSVARLLCGRVVADVGLQLRQLCHVGHEAVQVSALSAPTDAGGDRLVCCLKQAPQRAGDRVQVEVQTRLHGADGNLISSACDRLVTPPWPEAALRALCGDRTAEPGTPGPHHRLPHLHLGEGATRAAWLPLPTRLARAYGRLSGDPVATRPGRTGDAHAVLPVMGLRNLVLPHLAAMGLPLNRLSLTFASPAYLRRTLTLLARSPHFEVHDPIGRVVAWGECSD